MINDTLPALLQEIQIDPEDKELVDQVQAALLHPLAKSFVHCLETLQRLAQNVNGKARLWKDFSPMSFDFVVLKADGSRWINGGVIYHGSHDRGGDGGAPTFSVNVNPIQGWTLHT